MKPLTITAIFALLLAIPFMLHHRAAAKQVRAGSGSTGKNQEIRYDIDDFLS